MKNSFTTKCWCVLCKLFYNGHTDSLFITNISFFAFTDENCIFSSVIFNFVSHVANCTFCTCKSIDTSPLDVADDGTCLASSFDARFFV